MAIDLSAYEEDHRFRTDLLFFLKQTGHYIGQIFLESFTDKAKTRSAMYDLVAALEQKVKFDVPLRNAIVPQKDGQRSPVLDPYKADFIKLLEAHPPHRRGVFCNRLHKRHGIKMTFNNFCRYVETLKDKRHYLTHWAERSGKPKEFKDGDVIEALGMFLLPSMHPEITGAMTSAAVRLARLNRPVDRVQIDHVKDHLARCRNQRREMTRTFYSTVISTLPSAERQEWQKSREAWNKTYIEYYPDGAWPRYNLHNFRVRFSYIGASRMNEITRQLEAAWTASRGGAYQQHFSRDIEPLFLLAFRINRLVDATCLSLKEHDKMTFSRKQADKKGAMASPRLGDIRNMAAHGGLFWAVTDKQGNDLAVRDLFEALFRAIRFPHIPDAAERAGELKENLDRLFAAEDYCWVLPVDASADNPVPPIHVQRWTPRKRQDYGDGTVWRRDRRYAIRYLTNVWRTDLTEAFKASRETRVGEKN